MEALIKTPPKAKHQRRNVNELQIAKFASDERLTFTDIRRYSGFVMELKKRAEQYIGKSNVKSLIFCGF